MAREIVLKLSGHENLEVLGAMDELMNIPEFTKISRAVELLQRIKEALYGNGQP